jgi:hypothetical protein
MHVDIGHGTGLLWLRLENDQPKLFAAFLWRSFRVRVARNCEYPRGRKLFILS